MRRAGNHYVTILMSRSRSPSDGGEKIESYF